MPASASKTTSSRSSDGQEGSGLIGALVGVSVFLVLLLFAVHLVLNLYGASVVTAAAFDAARLRAGGSGAAASEAEAEAALLALLGGYRDGGRLDVSWTYPDTDGDGQPDTVALRVEAEHPGPRLAGVDVPFQHIDRTISVRQERLR
ncbi:MAG TPA: hypothetical protein VNT56_09510 [Acidimicrobiales bacterium]|nr:hypothetical protein [Acidimicrobiales bacterium]